MFRSTHPSSDMSQFLHLESSRLKLWAVPLGRFLFALIFIISGLNHFSSGSLSYAVNQGVPWANVLVPVSGLIALTGGLSVLLGFHARAGAFLILTFLLPVTFMMHNFWAFADPELAQMHLINFLKNLSLMGTAILITFYGAGPVSFDQSRRKHHSE